MKVFLYAFRLLSKVKAAILTTRTWYLSSDMPTRKYEKTDRANKIYKSELGLPIIPTSTERSINVNYSQVSFLVATQALQTSGACAQCAVTD